MEIGEIGGDAEGGADIVDPQVAKFEIVGACAELEQFVACGVSRLPVGRARAGELRRHRIAVRIDAAHHHRLALGPAARDAEDAGDVVIALVGEQQHFASRPRASDQRVERADRRRVVDIATALVAGSGG